MRIAVLVINCADRVGRFVVLLIELVATEVRPLGITNGGGVNIDAFVTCYETKLNSVAFSPQANYTDRTTASCPPSLPPPSPVRFLVLISLRG
jgi:hypothetical protein